MRVGFAGAGNMAAAIARGWAGAETRPESMSFFDIDGERARALADEVGGVVAGSLGELGDGADLVVLAVKPMEVDAVAQELHPKALLSVVAATPVAKLAEAFPDVPALRVMPNQPVEVRRGLLVHAPPAGMPDELAAEVLGLLAGIGEVVELDEPLIEAAMAVMACAPAYVAYVADALAGAGVREGLDPALSAHLVTETFAGTAELLEVRDAAAIQTAVAPPGGATEAGLEALDAAGVPAAFDAAVEASLERFR